MNKSPDLSAWRLQDRCHACHQVTTLAVPLLFMSKGYISWRCDACKTLNPLISANKLDRVARYVQSYIKAHSQVEPAPVVVKPDLAHLPRIEVPIVNPNGNTKLPWWRRLRAAIFQ